MKSGFLKYSDERNRRFSIKTHICLDAGEKKVVKQAVFEEGWAHLEHMFESAEKLKTYYKDVVICGVDKTKEGLEFEFISGKMLLEHYVKAAKDKDREAYERLLQLHQKIICGTKENQCQFEGSEKFREWFGAEDAYLGLPGLAYSNFDAIAGNIIMQGETPVFIDYEWTMDFAMPRDFVVYHCIYDGYLHHPELETFYPFAQVLEFLHIKTPKEAMEQSYEHFFNYVISDEEGKSYAKDKFGCLKHSQSIRYMAKEWEKCAEEWRKASKENERLTGELDHARKEWEECADHWKEAVNANETLMDHLKHAQAECQRLSENYADLEKRHEAVIRSKVWRAYMKLRRIAKKDTIG